MNKKDKVVRSILLTTYVMIVLLVHPVMLMMMTIVPDNTAASCLRCVVVFGLLYCLHQVFSHLHMRNEYKVLSYQINCSVIDLLVLALYAYYAMTPEYGVYVVWIMLLIAAQRIISLLFTVKRYLWS